MAHQRRSCSNRPPCRFKQICRPALHSWKEQDIGCEYNGKGVNNGLMLPDMKQRLSRSRAILVGQERQIQDRSNLPSGHLYLQASTKPLATGKRAATATIIWRSPLGQKLEAIARSVSCRVVCLRATETRTRGRGENLAKISLPAGAMLGGENLEEVSTGRGLEFEERRSITVPPRAHLGNNVQSSSTRNQRHAFQRNANS
jgi:hypothetical protein